MTFRDDLAATSEWVAAYLETAGARPVFPSVSPGEVRRKLPRSAPEAGEPFSDVLRDLDEIVMPGLTL